MGGVGVDPRQINSFDVRGWISRGMDFPLRLGNADGAFPGIRRPDQSPRGRNGA
jgi:hypothetical protein